MSTSNAEVVEVVDGDVITLPGERLINVKPCHSVDDAVSVFVEVHQRTTRLTYNSVCISRAKSLCYVNITQRFSTLGMLTLSIMSIIDVFFETTPTIKIARSH